VEKRLKDAYASWLGGFTWDFFVTPTFRYPKTQAQAIAAVREWLASKEPDVYAVVAYERGVLGGRLHCHVLIGGIGRHPLKQLHLAQSWRYGIVDVEPFNAGREGIRYMLDYADDPDGLELIGTPHEFKPRRRRARRK